LQNRPTESGLGLGCFTPTPPEEAVCFRAPTPWTTFKYVAVMKEAIEHGSDGGTIAEKLTPVVHGTIRGEQSAGALIAPHYDFQQVLGGGHGHRFHAKRNAIDVAERPHRSPIRRKHRARRAFP